MPDDPVATWLQRAAVGDREAFDALVAATRGGVWRLVRAIAPDDGAAEDALQETYLAAYRTAGTFRGEGSGRAWLYGVARHQALRTWRRRAGEPRDPVPLHELGARAGWGRSPEEVASAAEDRDRLRDALDQLSAADREVLVLVDLEGFTAPEVARMTQATANAVRVRLHRARLRLLARLEAVDA